MNNIDLTIPKGAIFSDDGNYRYALWRIWSSYKKPLMFIGLNPSTANQLENDPTITRLITRANDNGYGGILAGNLYALVSSNPKALLQKDIDTIGIHTNYYLQQMIKLSQTVLCAWGSFKPVIYRASTILKMIPDPCCLGVNADGQPKHPLYVGYNTPIIKYNASERG